MEQSGAIPVLPWGAGKWLGKRANVLRGAIWDASPGSLYLGDNGGRAKILAAPRPFLWAIQRRIGNLPGSDPLPLPGESARVGTFGFAVQQAAPLALAAVTLREWLLGGSVETRPFGHLQGLGRFIWNQSRLRLEQRIGRCRPD